MCQKQREECFGNVDVVFRNVIHELDVVTVQYENNIEINEQIVYAFGVQTPGVYNEEEYGLD